MREVFESTAERLFTELLTPDRARASEGGRWDSEAWQALEDAGFPVVAAAEASGGAGAPWGDVYGLVRAAGHRPLPLPFAETLFSNWLIGRAGLELLPGPLSFGASAELRITGGVVHGRVAGVPWGRSVGHVVAVAGGDVPTLVVLPRAGATAIEESLNIAREPRDALTFAGARAVAAAPLPPGLEPDVCRLGGAMLRAAQIAGALARILEMSVRYASERQQFGKPIGSFQSIQHQIAVLAEHAASAAVAAEAPFAHLDDRLDTDLVAIAKICTSESAGSGAAIAHAVHGAIGFTDEYSLQLSTRRLWAWRSEFGAEAAWSQSLGRAVCAAGSAQLWPSVTHMGLAGRPNA